MMKRAVYSPMLDAYRSICPEPDIYLAPKRLISSLKRMVSCPLVALEDLDKTETWLWLNEVVRPETRIIYDRTARYYKVNSEKSRRLARLAEIANVFLVDIVPFFEHRRYVSRTILGYQHFYAFSGDHAEEFGGRVVSSLDQGLLSAKIAPHVAKCETFNHVRRIIKAEASPEEQRMYASKKDELFSRYKTPQPIITRLADLVHAFESRRAAASGLRDCAVVCNLDSYVKYYSKPGVTCGTYAKPPKLQGRSRIVFAEPPIVYTYRRFDIESQANGAEVIDIVGDTKLDLHLYGRMESEINEVIGFQERLRESLSE